MNNSDFLSDAVALDLGKSGVKIAETLEIEVGTEWWRLINAADVMDVTAFQKRRYQDPIISEGTLHLEGFKKTNFKIAQALPYPTSRAVNYQHYPGVAFCTSEGEYRYAVGWMSSYSDTASYFTVSIYNDLGEQLSSITNTGYPLSSSGSHPGYVPIAVVVDTVNNRVLAFTAASADHGITFSSTRPVFVMNLSTGTSAYSMASGNMLIHHCRSFLEAPGAGYSILRGETLRVKKHSFLLEENWANSILDLNSTTDSVTVSDAENFGTSPKLFYSRWHESVAVVWYDSVAKTPYYVLESEGWDTPHALPDFCNDGEWGLEDFGNLAVPKNGEFLIGALKKIPSENIKRPTGWSYPANFNVSSVFDLGDGTGVIWGNVGTTLYRLTFQVATMTIAAVESKALTVLPSAGVYIHLLGISLDGDKELYTITEVYSGSNSDRWQNGIFVWCRSTGSILFEFGGADRLNQTYFPTAYAAKSGTDQSSNFFCRMLSPTHLLILRVHEYSYNDYFRQDYYVISTTDIFACTSKNDFLDLLSNIGVVSKTLSLYYRMGPTVSSKGPIFDPSVSIHDDAYYYIPTFGYYSNQSLTMRFSKNTFDMDLIYWGGSVPFTMAKDFTRLGVQRFGDSNPYVSETSLSTIDEKSDGYLYAYSVSVPYFYFVFGSLSALAKTNRATLYAANTDVLTDIYPLSLPTGASRTRMFLPMYGTDAYVWGVCHESTLEGNVARRIPLGHTHWKSFRSLAPNNNAVYSISKVVSEEISYRQLNGQEGGDLGKYIAISNKGEVFDVSGLEGDGGLLRLHFSGRGIHAVTGHARHLFLDTEADLLEGAGDGYGGTGGGGTTNFAGYIYTYLADTFTPYPFAREGIRAELSNISKTTKITLPETRTNLIRGLLASGTDFRGSRCILRRIFPDHADTTGSDIVLLDGYIQDWSYVPGKKGIAFTVSKTLIDVGAQFPKRLMNMGCSHVFKGERCKYLGETGRCLKTKAFCQFLNNQNQFGGFPWVAARQRRVMWR